MKEANPSVLRHLPNALCILRILLAAPIAWLIMGEHAQAAAGLFVVAAASDVVDGWLAKRFHWQSQLGGWLDPLADKTLVMAACVALAAHGEIPAWLLALIVLRDVVIVSGAITFHFRYAPLNAAPTVIGKLTTFVLVALVVLLLVDNAYGSVPSWLTQTLIGVCALLLVASGFDYVRRWAAKARRLQGNHS